MGGFNMKQQTIHIAGAGLAGALLAILLVQKGHTVRIYEKRPDPRKASVEGGRSINLALAYRGLHALQQAGLDDEVMPQVVMMRGRMVHDVSGNTHFLRYGKDDSEVIWSVHRGRLNLALIEAAEKQGVIMHFNARIGDIDLVSNTLRIDYLDHSETESFGRLIGADGAGSAVRRVLAEKALSVSAWRHWATITVSLKSPPTHVAISNWMATACISGRAAAICALPCRIPKRPSP